MVRKTYNASVVEADEEHQTDDDLVLKHTEKKVCLQ